jgi:flavin reductase
MSSTNTSKSLRTSAPAPIPVDRQQYRNAMSRVAAAVNIITSRGPDGVCGFTASAVCSVTDDPPTLLVCVNRSNQSYPVISVSRVLCVNTIAAHHEALASAFAGGVKEMVRRFEVAAWATEVTGSPVLEGAAASFDCRIVQITNIGTHDVFYCEVLAVRQMAGSNALVYHDRKFHRVA